MYKASFELFRIHKSFKVKFSLIVKDDKQDKFSEVVNKFNFLGNDFLRITPFPYITIDITSKMDRNEEWSTNRTFNMNRRELFIMIQKLQKLYTKFVSEKQLFYYDNMGILQVNKELSHNIREIIVCGNKKILLQPCVVENEEDHLLYEGVFLSINSIDYFTYLTYGELEYFLYELKRIDMSSLTLQLLNSVYLFNEMESKELKKKAPIPEIKVDEIEDTKVRIKIDEPNTIPEI